MRRVSRRARNAQRQALDMFADQIKARAQIHNFRTITCHSRHSSWRRTRFRFGVDVPGPTIWRHLRSGCHRFYGWDVGSVIVAAVTHCSCALCFCDRAWKSWRLRARNLDWVSRRALALERICVSWRIPFDTCVSLKFGSRCVPGIWSWDSHHSRGLDEMENFLLSVSVAVLPDFFLRRGGCSYGTWFERRVARAGSERRSGTSTDTEADPGHRVKLASWHLPFATFFSPFVTKGEKQSTTQEGTEK